MVYGVPYICEDKTGRIYNTHFQEIYERMQLTVSARASSSGRAQGPFSVKVYDAKSSSPVPSVILDFGAGGALGSIQFARQPNAMPMSSWLRITCGPGRSMSASFTCSDSLEYKWTHKPSQEPDVEWVCTSLGSRSNPEASYVAARYTLSPPSESFGNSFTVEETYGSTAVEFLAALIILRHVLGPHQ